jgi:hypothetical protein
MEVSKIEEGVMSIYYNPPEEVQEVGRQLQAGSYSELVSQLRGDEMLFGLYDHLVFKHAPHLFSEAEMEEFEGQYRTGMLVNHDFFAVPRSVAEEKGLV